MAFLGQLIDDVVVNKIELAQPEVTIGRHPDSTILINDLAVSARHAVIIVEKNKYLTGVTDFYIEDTDSTNGSYVNGQLITGRHKIVNNDVLRFAWNEFKLIEANENTMDITAHIVL